MRRQSFRETFVVGSLTMSGNSRNQTHGRTHIPKHVRIEVLTESGYRCAVPTCRGILAIDMHHIVPVREGGASKTENLLALCPNCHALYERGIMDQTSIIVWKAFLASLSRAYDHHTVDLLWFLDRTPGFKCSADGVVHFARLIGAGFAELNLGQNGFGALVEVSLSNQGIELLYAWRHADSTYFMHDRR